MHQSASDQPFTVLTWNVNFRQAAVLEAFISSYFVPDILTLQEVSIGQADSFCTYLSEIGLQSVIYSGRADNSQFSDQLDYNPAAR